MKLLVLSDSHSSYSLMRKSVQMLQPDVVIHLGDHYEDGTVIHQENPNIPFFQVPGNCDTGCYPVTAPKVLIKILDGVKILMTHGHLHHVKQSTDELLEEAKRRQCNLVLFGHTHRPECFMDSSGIWVMNPGSCGYYGGTVGIIELQDKAFLSCRIISSDELLEMEQ